MSAINVALLGAGGQLGKTFLASREKRNADTTEKVFTGALVNAVSDTPDEARLADLRLYAFTREQLDICEQDRLTDVLGALDIQVIVNAAAYTQVDRAESDEYEAMRVNREGAANVATFAAGAGCRLIHVSTDFVFAGTAGRAYKPGDATGPVNVYGATKLAGEQAVQSACGDRALIVRTGWLYSGYASNFLTTMLRLMSEREHLGIVADQVGTPTSTGSLVRFIDRIIASNVESGIYHWSDAGVASWYDFAVAIQEEATGEGLLGDAIPIVPISTQEYPTPAARPDFSVLDKSTSYRDFNLTPVHWREELRRSLRTMRN